LSYTGADLTAAHEETQMPKRRARWLAVSMLCAWLLSGCVTTLAPTQPLPREAFASVVDVAVAVGPGGVKHYAWTECFGEEELYTCVLVYSRVVMGAVTYSHGFVTPIGKVWRYPDVAVSSTGDAYVVSSRCTNFSNCYDYWTMFPAANPESVEPVSELLYSPQTISLERPVVEARGDDVYAAYVLEEADFRRLRYRQLSGGDRSGYIDSTQLSPVYASLAVDSNGDLHAVWVRNPVTDTFVAYSNNVGAANNFNAPIIFHDGNNALITAPDLALKANDRAYLAYSINNGISDTVKVRCTEAITANCYRAVSALDVPHASGGWNVYGSVHLELINDQPNVVFSAANAAELYDEVWWYHPPSSGDDNPPTQVTNTSVENEGEPLIVKEHSDAGDVAVVGWRQFQNFLLDEQGPAGNAGHCEGDVFVTYANTSSTRQVFTDRGTCANSGLDLAANGEWVAGVWIDEESDVIEAHAAWTSFNAHVVYVPISRK
jgi:hypothetical protein